MIVRDKYGYPVETIFGKHIKNFLRILIHGNIKQTWKLRNGKKA